MALPEAEAAAAVAYPVAVAAAAVAWPVAEPAAAVACLWLWLLQLRLLKHEQLLLLQLEWRFPLSEFYRFGHRQAEVLHCNVLYRRVRIPIHEVQECL